MIDRALRSRFPSDYRDELSLIVTVMSYDEENDPVLLAINAASVALLNSRAPFDGPVSGVRMTMDKGEIKATYKSMEDVTSENVLNYVLGGDGNLFTMVDAACFEIPEEQVLKAMEMSLEEMKKWNAAQNEFVKLLEKKDKNYKSYDLDEDMLTGMQKFLGERVIENLLKADKSVHESTKEEVYKEFEGKYTKLQMSEGYEKLLKKAMRKHVVEQKKRADGRGFDEIREMDAEIDLLPRVHGSGLFTRGVTQVLSIATLGTLEDAKMVDDMFVEKEKRYMHYYNDLPFAYGDVDRVRLSQVEEQ